MESADISSPSVVLLPPLFLTRPNIQLYAARAVVLPAVFGRSIFGNCSDLSSDLLPPGPVL